MSSPEEGKGAAFPIARIKISTGQKEWGARHVGRESKSSIMLSLCSMSPQCAAELGFLSASAGRQAMGAQVDPLTGPWQALGRQAVGRGVLGSWPGQDRGWRPGSKSPGWCTWGCPRATGTPVRTAWASARKRPAAPALSRWQLPNPPL